MPRVGLIDEAVFVQSEDAIEDPDDIRQLELDITGIRRLSITVDYGKNLDFGDLLHLGDAKLIK